MSFKPTNYRLMDVATGRVFADEGWTLSDPQAPSPSLVRAEYEQREFHPRENLDGLYRYADWLPVRRTLSRSSAPATYKSEGLAELLGMSNLYITFSGFAPSLGVAMETCSFKETEAFSVCGRWPYDNSRILVVQSAGNTARAFARVCSDNNIPVVISIPADNCHDLWFVRPLKNCVKVIAAPEGSDYYDAIALGEKLGRSPRYCLEGGARNIARRDGMATTVLSAVEKIGRIPDAYFQAVGSGTGAIAAWEAVQRLKKDGRFGSHDMKIFTCQNSPFTILYDSWKAGSRDLLPFAAEESRRRSEAILAKVLSNRKPPYGIAGGLYDAMRQTGGDMFKVSNDELIVWMLRFFQSEGIDIFPAAACAVASLAKALEEGKVGKNDTVMLNITGGGMLEATRKGFTVKKPDLVLSPNLPEEEIIAAVDNLFG